MNTPFFSLFKPVLNYIDSGRFFREPMSWLYAVCAGLNLLAPLVIFYVAVDNNIFDAPGKVTITFLLAWVFIAFAGWIGFQIWWDRRERVLESSRAGDEFTASLAFAHLVQTAGEWYGTIITIIGTSATFWSVLFLGSDSSRLFRSMDLEFLALGQGFLMILVWPVLGYLQIVVSRVIAELIRSLGAIANNTKRVIADSPATEPLVSQQPVEPPVGPDLKQSLGF